MLTETLFIFAVIAMGIGYVSRERLFWVSDGDRVATDILENSHVTNDLWITFYRQRDRIDAQYRTLINVYFWSSLSALVLLVAGFTSYWLAA